MAVVMTRGDSTSKRMQVQTPEATFHDLTEHHSEKVQTDANGWADFPVAERSVSVWVLSQ